MSHRDGIYRRAPAYKETPSFQVPSVRHPTAPPSIQPSNAYCTDSYQLQVIISTMSSMKPLKIWGASGPNPPKVGYVCEELSLPYDVVDIPFTDLKTPSYLAVNANGRVPALYDPNTDLTLWESGAIVEYLVERYDVEKKISFEVGSKEAQLARQWLIFQVSGQGPYVSTTIIKISDCLSAWADLALCSTASSCGSTSTTRKRSSRRSIATRRRSSA